MEGKFRAEQQKNGLPRGEDWGGNDHQRWEDEEVDPEDVDVEDRSSKDRLSSSGSCEREKEDQSMKENSAGPVMSEKPEENKAAVGVN